MAFQSILRAWLVIVPLAAVWQVVMYSGLYRWLCEAQLDSFGSYMAVLTALVPAAVLMAPAFLLLLLRSRAAGPGADRPPPRVLKVAEVRVQVLLVMVGLPLVAALVCAGALIGAMRVPSVNGPSRDVDLARLGNAPPPLGRVTLIGTVDAGHVTRKIHDGRGDHGFELYAPMRVPGASDGMARLFVNETGVAGTPAPLPTGPGKRFKGVIVEGGLPRDMHRQFERIGVRVATPYFVLHTGPGGARKPYYVVAGVAGFLAWIGFAILAMLVTIGPLRRRRA